MKKILLAFLLAVPFCAHAQIINTIAGCGIGNDSLAVNAEVLLPMKVAFDRAGNTYIADQVNNMVRKVDPTGVITTFAGTGDPGNAGDGGPATAASFQGIYSVGTDGAGNVYIVDGEDSRVRKVNTAGIITTIAGISGSPGYSADGIAATTAQLDYPSDIAIDTAGNIFIADRYSYRVRKINTAGIISTVAGTGALGSATSGPATAAALGYPYRIALDSKGELFIATYAPWYILKVDTTDSLRVIAGTGTYGYSGDGGAATAATFSAPCGLTLDTAGNVYFSDIDNSRVRMVSKSTGIINTVVGTGAAGYSGDGGPATAATISGPEGVSFDSSNNLYVAEISNNRVRMITPAGAISTYAGRNGLFSEGYPATNAEIAQADAVTTDAAGNVYIADIYNHRVRMINAATGVMTTVAGAGISGYDDGFSGDGGPATAAHLYYPSAMVADPAGNLYICDQDNQRIRKVSTSGIITTIAGNGTAGYSGDGGHAVNAEFHFPTGICLDAAGNIYVCDNNNHCIRKITPAGIISTVAGVGSPGSIGDGGPATGAQLSYPDDVVADAYGNIYISDQGNERIRMVDTNGKISTIAGVGTYGYFGDGGPAAFAQFADPRQLAIDAAGDLFIADYYNQVVRMIDASGNISTVAGNNNFGFSGDGGPATAAKLNGPGGVAIDQSGNLYIADDYNNRIRMVNMAYLSVHNIPHATTGIDIYPNPATRQLTIQSNQPINEVSITNLLGQTAYQTSSIQHPASSIQVNVSNLPASVYFVKVNGTEVRKFVKE